MRVDVASSRVRDARRHRSPRQMLGERGVRAPACHAGAQAIDPSDEAFCFKGLERLCAAVPTRSDSGAARANPCNLARARAFDLFGRRSKIVIPRATSDGFSAKGRPMSKRSKLWFLAFIALGPALAGCTTFMETQDASNPLVVGQASAIPLYTTENASAAPRVKTIVGPAFGNSCKLHVYDANGSEIAALQQLRLKVYAMGANGVVGVTYSHGGTSLAANCWQNVTASGTAVIFDKATTAQ